MVAQIGFGHEQRIFNRRARAGRKQTVEAAVERHAGDNRDQDRGRGGDNGKQADDADMQPGGGAARAARLHHLPDFAHDDCEQQNDGRRVGQQQRDDDVMGRRDRRQIGENDESGKGRQQRQDDRDRPHDPRFTALGRRCGERRFGTGGLVDAHESPAGRVGGKCGGRKCAPGAVESVPSTDAFIQHCCRIATRLRQVLTSGSIWHLSGRFGLKRPNLGDWRPNGGDEAAPCPSRPCRGPAA